MGSPCLFTRQQGLKMGYFYWLRVKSSNHFHTELNLGYLKGTSFVLKVKLHCCGASVASEQEHKQDLRRIYKREYEFSKSSLFTRMLCAFLPECTAPFYQNALRLLPECITPRTTRGCDTVVVASFFCMDFC